MRNVYIFVIGFLILFSSWGSFAVYDKYFGNDALENEVFAHLTSVAESKANRIGFFLDERKDDLVFLANSKEVVDLMNAIEITEAVDDKLKFFRETNAYLDLVLIDVGGDILWSAKGGEFVGRDLNSSEYNSSELGKVYNKVKKDFGVGIFDPGYFGRGERLSVFVTSPVLVDSETVAGKKDIIGIIALQIDNSQIESRIVSPRDDSSRKATDNSGEPSGEPSDIGLGETGEIYLVNRDGTVTAGLGSVSEIDTQMFKDCFKDYDNYYFERQGQEINSVEKSGVYVNYLGEKVFGAHQYILETGWCVMVEVDRNEFYDSLRSGGKNG